LKPRTSNRAAILKEVFIVTPQELAMALSNKALALATGSGKRLGLG
jgi:hypothetical protein